MIAAILKSAILDSAILYKKNFTHSFWLNLMMAAILNSAVLDSAILHKTLTLHSDSFKHLNWCWHLLSDSLIHSHSTWWWQPSWILPCWIQPFVQKKLHSCILTQIEYGSHLEFCHFGFRHCHLGFRHLVIFSQIHSKTLSLHSDSVSN